MKVKIVTPDQANARAWGDALRSQGGFDVKEVVSALNEASIAINGSRPDLVLVQTTSPQDIDTMERLCGAHPEVDVVLVSPTLEPEILMRALRAGVREVLQAPCAPAAVVAAVIAAQSRQMRKRLGWATPEPGPAGQVLALASCKGGCGTTFIAANLAHLLTQEGRRRVALIDLNLQFGDAALFVSDGRGNSHVADVARHIDRLDTALLRSSMREALPGLWVLAAPEDPAQSVEVTRDHVRRIVELAREMHDHVVIDAGRALSPVTRVPFARLPGGQDSVDRQSTPKGRRVQHRRPEEGAGRARPHHAAQPLRSRCQFRQPGRAGGPGGPGKPGDAGPARPGARAAAAPAASAATRGQPLVDRPVRRYRILRAAP